MIHRDEIEDMIQGHEPVVVSFHTPDKHYSGHAAAMKASAEAYLSEVYVEEVPLEFDTWARAVAFKPVFLDQCFERFSGRPILWVDADARFVARPDLFLDEPLFELSYHKHQWSQKHEKEHLSGVMYFGADWHDRREFVRLWATSIHPNDEGNQPGLKRAFTQWRSSGNRVIYRDCGPEYVWIFDRFPKLYPSLSPIIEQLQESRAARKRYRNQRLAGGS